MAFKQKITIYIFILFNQICNAAMYAVYYLYLTNDLKLSNEHAVMLTTPMFVMKLIFELPTGFFADRYGLKKSIIISYFLMLVDAVIFVSTKSYPVLFISSGIYGIGAAFFSGAFEAFTVELFKDDLQKYFSNKHILENLFTVIVPLGVVFLLPLINYRGIYLINVSIRIFMLAFLLLNLKEPKSHGEIPVFGIEFLRLGMGSLIKEIKISKSIQYHAIASFLWGFAFLIIDIYWIKIFSINYGDSWVGYFLSICGVLGIFVGFIGHKIKNQKRLYWLSFAGATIMLTLSCFVMGSNIFILVFLIRSFLQSIHDVISPNIVNKIIEKDRASLLSFLSFVSTIGSIIASTTIGRMADVSGYITPWVICAVLMMVISFLLYKVQKEMKN